MRASMGHAHRGSAERRWSRKAEMTWRRRLNAVAPGVLVAELERYLGSGHAR
jgi:hypothetical protein